MSHREIAIDTYRRYRTGLSINIAVAIMQLVTLALFARSLTLYGDTMHGIADILILLGTTILAKKASMYAHEHHGMRKRILAIIAVLLLWMSAGYIVLESITRISTPTAFPGWVVIVVALLAAVGNFFAHRIISGVDDGEKDSLHEANVAHLLTDCALSCVVVISGLGVLVFGLPSIDAWFALCIVAPFMTLWGGRILLPKTEHSHHGHHH